MLLYVITGLSEVEEPLISLMLLSRQQINPANSSSSIHLRLVKICAGRLFLACSFCYAIPPSLLSAYTINDDRCFTLDRSVMEFLRMSNAENRIISELKHCLHRMALKPLQTYAFLFAELLYTYIHVFYFIHS